MTFSFSYFAKLATLAVIVLAPSMASAQFKLDSRYIDANGDMVADVPTDPKNWVDPATLVFAYTPVEDPAVYAKVWQGFLDHMTKVTGKKVVFFPVQSNAAQLEAMRAGRLHVAGFNTGSNPIAVACSGFVPFTMMASKDDKFGYEMEIITYPGSGIEKVEDVKGGANGRTCSASPGGTSRSRITGAPPKMPRPAVTRLRRADEVSNGTCGTPHTQERHTAHGTRNGEGTHTRWPGLDRRRIGW